MRNEVWGWDIPAIVQREIDDVLAQDLIIQVRPFHASENENRLLTFRFRPAARRRSR